MNKTTLRIATSMILLASSFAASATEPITQPLELKGVFNEKVGPKAGCPSGLGGTLAGHGESADGANVAFVGGDCFSQSGYTFTFSNGKFILLTVAGDQIFANYSGQFVPTGDGSKFVMNGGTFQVTGGAGKYEKAIGGGGTLNGTEDLSTGAGTLQLSGNISFKPK